MALSQLQIGPQVVADGATPTQRGGRSGEVITTQLHGRYYEQALRGGIFTGGMGVTSISNATYTSATTGVTATPIAGIYNPASSGKNAVILLAQLGVVMTSLQATGGGPYVWMANTSAGPISTGAAPFNATLAQAGSACKNMANAALTGMTGAIAVVRGSSLFGGSAATAAFLATQVALQTQQQSSEEHIDGAIIVPPNTVLALMATSTPVGHSAVSGLVWEEIPV